MGESEFSDDEDVDGTTLSPLSFVEFVLFCVDSIILSFEITPSIGDMPASDTLSLSFDSFVVLRRNNFLTNDIPTIDTPNPRKTITILVYLIDLHSPSGSFHIYVYTSINDVPVSNIRDVTTPQNTHARKICGIIGVKLK